MKKAIRIMALGILVLGFAAAAAAEVKTTFYGYNWLRYTDVVKGADIQGESTFSIPRTYLRWKMADADMGWAGEITLDINNVKGGQEISTSSASSGATDADGSGTTITSTHTHTYNSASGKVDFAIWPKYAYVEFTKIPVMADLGMKFRVGQQKNYFGTVDLYEYDLIEKTITDLRKVMSSADLGAAILGEIPEGYGSYEFAVHNGSGYKLLDTNVEKQYSASVMVLPITGLMVRGSYTLANTSAHGAAAKMKTAVDGVVQYVIGPVRMLAEYVCQHDKSAASASKTGVSEGIMAMAVVDVLEWLQVAGRYDAWNPDTKVQGDETNLYIGGVNIKFNENILLQLNYQLEEPKYGGTTAQHVNTWLAQSKWSW